MFAQNVATNCLVQKQSTNTTHLGQHLPRPSGLIVCPKSMKLNLKKAARQKRIRYSEWTCHLSVSGSDLIDIERFVSQANLYMALTGWHVISTLEFQPRLNQKYSHGRHFA